MIIYYIDNKKLIYHKEESLTNRNKKFGLKIKKIIHSM